MRQTSIDAYRQIETDGTLGRLQLLVYQYLYKNGPLTTRQVHFGVRQAARDVGIVSTRLTELTDMGVVYEVKEVKCSVTGMTVILWDVTDRLPRKRGRVKRIKCEHCTGRGWIKPEEEKNA